MLIAIASIISLASVAKYLGLFFTLMLGVAGTAADTHETKNGKVRVTWVGWTVMALITMSAVVGAIGQRYDDVEKETAENRQIEKLKGITETVAESRERFSGRLRALVEVNIPTDQAFISGAIGKYQAAVTELKKKMGGGAILLSRTYPHDALIDAIAVKLKDIAFDVDLFSPSDEHHVLLAAQDMMPATNSDIDIQGIDLERKRMNVVFSVQSRHLFNKLFSLSEFGNQKLILSAHLGRTDKQGRFPWPQEPDFRMEPVGIEVYDQDMNTQLTETWFAVEKVGDRSVYAGYTKQLSQASRDVLLKNKPPRPH